MDGILLIDKPSGWTSFDVVAKIRNTIKQAQSTELRVLSPESGALSSKLSALSSGGRLLATSKKVKVGHTGTLDPLATGLLVLVLGDYCKRASEFSKLDKTYEVTMWLGKTSTTGDDEGGKTPVSDSVPAHEEIQDALGKFVGEIMQTPPIYSAIKVNGQRAYKLARAGQAIELEPRPVTIYSTELTDYTYPEVTFTAKVSSGTYIRSLVEDLGKELETGAYMSNLRRTEVGIWEVHDAVSIENIRIEQIVAGLKTL